MVCRPRMQKGEHLKVQARYSSLNYVAVPRLKTKTKNKATTKYFVSWLFIFLYLSIKLFIYLFMVFKTGFLFV